VKRSNVRALRLKYRALRKRGYLYAHIQGPRVVATNFALDGWTHALGGFFTRHGNRRYGQNSVAPLLRRLQSETLQRGISRWLVDLRPEDRNRPDFIYGHLRQRFPHRSAEAERQWIVRLRRRLLRTEREEGPAPPPPSDQRLRMDLPPGTLELDPPLEEVSLERAHLDQLNLRWHAPGRIYLSPLCLPLWGLAAQRRRSVVGAGGRRAVVPPLGGVPPSSPAPGAAPAAGHRRCAPCWRPAGSGWAASWRPAAGPSWRPVPKAAGWGGGPPPPAPPSGSGAAGGGWGRG
jgi:hypothetical protein